MSNKVQTCVDTHLVCLYLLNNGPDSKLAKKMRMREKYFI